MAKAFLCEIFGEGVYKTRKATFKVKTKEIEIVQSSFHYEIILTPYFLNDKQTFNNLIDTEAFNNSGITITPDGGFGGFVSRVRYYPYYINPEKAWSIYKDGFGDAFESALSKYNMSLSVYEDQIEKNKFFLF